MADHPTNDAPSGDPPPPQTATCQMCRREVPANQIAVLGGRSLCFGCAGAWFDEDEAE